MILGAVLAVVLLASWVLVGWCIAQRAVPDDAVLRALVTLVAVPWTLNAGFWLLAGVGAFGIASGTVLGLTAAGGAFWWRRREIRHVLPSDLGRARAAVRAAFSGWMAILSVPLLLLAGVRVLRGSLLPPLAWDALTYRLFKAGSWAGSGTAALEAAPDAWGYYRFFPAAGEVLWAWAMLPFSSDAGIAAAGFVVWLGLVLAVALAGRAIGAERSAALATGLAVGAMPVLLSFVTSGYVHGFVTLQVVAGAALARDYLRSGSGASGVFAAAAFALAGAAHPGTLPVVAIGAFALGCGLFRRRGWRIAVAMVLATSVAWPWPVMAVLETGSPLYPLSLRVGGVEILEGHPQLDRLHRGEPFAVEERLGFGDLLALQLWDPGAPGQEMLSFGPGGAVLLLLSAVGWVLWWRRERAGPLLSVALFVATLLPILSEAAGAMHTPWGAPMLGRHLLPGAVCLIWAAAVVRGRSASVVRGTAVLLGILWGWPRGIGEVGWAAIGRFVRLGAPVWILAVLVGLAAWRLRKPGLGWAAAAFAIFASVPVVESVRDSHREAAWRAAARAKTYDLHPLSPRAVGVWPLWTALADAPPLRIAYTAGWDEIGHNWYRQPFLGSRLQHTLLYVPLTADGAILDYDDMESVVRAADFRAWLRRLVDRRVDLLVTAPPDTLEGLWAEDHPRIFQPSLRAGGGTVYRIDREIAATVVDTPSEEAHAR